MINIPKANEIKELTDNVNSKKLERREQEAEKYLCKTVVPEITSAAEKGYYEVKLVLGFSEYYIASYVKRHLEGMGYEITISYNKALYEPILVTIYWGDAPF